MFRPLDTTPAPPPAAYRVPWHVDRSNDAHPIVRNDARDPADFVRIFHENAADSGRTDLWGQVLPGERIELCLCAADLNDVVVTIAWFRQTDGLEYIWRFVV